MRKVTTVGILTGAALTGAAIGVAVRWVSRSLSAPVSMPVPNRTAQDPPSYPARQRNFTDENLPFDEAFPEPWAGAHDPCQTTER